MSSGPHVNVPQRTLITAPIDEQQLTRLKGNTHPLARAQFDLGTAPASLPMQRMLLVLKRSPEQEHALRTLLDDQQDKNSPNYHKWVTPEQYGKLFGPSDADMQTITSWLQSHGFEVGATKGRSVLEFSGSASQVQEAFHTTIHKYVVNGEQHWANSSDPMIPTALTPAVAGVYTLHNFLKKPHYRLAKEKGIITPGKPPRINLQGGGHALSPGDYAAIYNINPLYNASPTPINGNGISIGIVGRSDIQLSDIQQFESLFGGSSILPQVIVNGPDPGDLPGDDVEATLDVTWSGAIAPGAQIIFVNSAITDTTDGVTLSELYIVENNLTNIMSASFGGCEANFGGDASGDNAIARQAAAQGISFFASTGDAGAEGCDDPNFESAAQGPVSVDLPAAAPFVTAVGGTQFNENGNDAIYWNSTNGAGGESALKYIPEDVWNESCAATSCGNNANIAAGGGGISTIFPKPNWQSVVTGTGTLTNRAIPDLALTAAGHDAYALCFLGVCAQNEFFLISGTSASTPSFAGIMALVDQQMGITTGNTRQGLANYVLYPLAAAQEANANLSGHCNGSSTSVTINTGCVFNDVTVGNNAVPDTQFTSTLYPAAVGYDPASGLGSVNAANLVNQWANSTFRATTTALKLNGGTTAVSITHGASVTADVNVTATTGTPTGDVSLIAATGPSGSATNQTGVAQLALSNTGTTSGSITVLPGGGPYAVTAHYAGISATTPPSTTFFAASDSNPVMITVSPEASTTTLSDFGVDSQGNLVQLANGASLQFGSLVYVRADVTGTNNASTECLAPTFADCPTGTVTFADQSGALPGPIFGPVVNPVGLNSQGNTAIGSLFNGVVNYDKGNHSISATYSGDASFNPSPVSNSITFTITPGFTAFLGSGFVLIKSPGQSGTILLGAIASTGFTSAVTISCSGLPAEAACNMPAVTPNGPNNIQTGTITVTTKGPHLVMAEPSHRTFYVATMFSGLPLAGIFLLVAPKRRRWTAVFGLTVIAMLVIVPACGGGGHATVQQQQDPGTPTGQFNVTVSASAGGIAGQIGTFTLVVQ